MHDALLAETMACKHALEAAIQFGISMVVVETDSAELKEAIDSEEFHLWVRGNLFREIKELAVENFNIFSICKISRVCNSFAHDLVSLSMSWDLGQYHFWTNPLPEFVKNRSICDWAEFQLINEGR